MKKFGGFAFETGDNLNRWKLTLETNLRLNYRNIMENKYYEKLTTMTIVIRKALTMSERFKIYLWFLSGKELKNDYMNDRIETGKRKRMRWKAEHEAGIQGDVAYEGSEDKSRLYLENKRIRGHVSLWRGVWA